MARRAQQTTRAEKGQALVEAALLIPVLVILIAGVFDLGRYYVMCADVQSACDTVCRSIEAKQEAPLSELEDELKALYPNMASSLVLEVSDPIITTTEHTGQAAYHIYDADAGVFRDRPQKLSQERREVTVSLTQGWITPGMMAIAGVTGGNEFTISCSNTATIDRTLEVW